jgi:hypothetical protein
MYACEASDLIHLLGRMVRVRNGKQTFVGILTGPSETKFSRDANRSAYGFVVEGEDFRMQFAWWDWYVEPFQAVEQPQG